MTYDVHAHCIPPAFREWLEQSGRDVGLAIVEGSGGTCVRFNDRYTTGP